MLKVATISLFLTNFTRSLACFIKIEFRCSIAQDSENEKSIDPEIHTGRRMEKLDFKIDFDHWKTVVEAKSLRFESKINMWKNTN